MKKKVDLAKVSEEELLELKISELPVQIPGTWLEDCIEQLYKELDAKGIKFKPQCYLADEWLTPDNEPVIGIPFFLAHPALIKLEKKIMLDAEGSTKQWCMKLLRHEAGHALNYAFRFYRRKKWQKIFGKFSSEYSDTYRFRPYSRSFVRHLEDYYAQYHPDEDFAETFAVWLSSDDWSNTYRGWKALAKIQYVDKLMQQFKNKEPRVNKGTRYWNIPSLKIKLANYYKKKKHFYAENFPDFHDVNLKRIFYLPGNEEEDKDKSSLPLACEVIKRYRRSILDNISAWTGEKKYIVDKLLQKIIERCQCLKLKVSDDEAASVLKISVYATVLIMNYIHTGRFSKRK